MEIISIILQATNIQRCPNAGGLGYYAQLLSLSYISGLKAKGYYQLAAGYGTIGYEPEVNTFFGQPRSISTGGVAFDIPMIHIIQNQDGDAEKAKKFSLQVGTLGSALEHITPEQMLAPTDPNAPKPDAISAVKALQKASAAGQKIYKITKDNIDQVLPFLQHGQEARNDIIRGVNAGKEVTTHTDAVSIPGGWSGFGYIITDPVLGDGVYKISGGLNGGWLIVLLAVIVSAIAIFNAGKSFDFLELAWQGVNFWLFIRAIKNSTSDLQILQAGMGVLLGAILGKRSLIKDASFQMYLAAMITELGLLAFG